MKYLILPILLTILCFSGFTSQVQAQNGPALMSLEHGGTTDVMGSREFDVFVCNEFEVELWIRQIPSMVALVFAVTWDPDMMELQNVELHLPSGWRILSGPIEQADSWFIILDGLIFSSNWEWMTFTFHCKGEGSSPINIPETYDPGSGSIGVGPYLGATYVSNTKLKAAVTQTIEPAPVGGLATPTNKLAILTPYIALAGLIAAVSTVIIIKRRKD